MLLLAIETSCDETAASVVEHGSMIRSNVISSTQAEFAHTGGVIPEEAARRQGELMIPVVHQALIEAGVSSCELDGIAYTEGPGLKPSLSVGISTAHSLASAWSKPLLPVDHTLGHLYSCWISEESKRARPFYKNPEYPIIALSVSGGHTNLWLLYSHQNRTLLGQTRDDAAGEAFDKGATLLGLPYPGGPQIQKLAESCSGNRYTFPIPLKDSDDCDFSFSGLKTALKTSVSDADQDHAALAKGYQEAICLHLVDKLENAYQKHPDVSELHVVGGVSLNSRLSSLVQERFSGLTIRFPAKGCSTDNAAMIAAAAYYTRTQAV